MEIKLTWDQAVALYDSAWWVGRDPAEVVRFQLCEDRLCMPLRDFRAALEAVLKRPVFNHELAGSNIDRLQAEVLGTRPAPGPRDIIELLRKQLGGGSEEDDDEK